MKLLNLASLILLVALSAAAITACSTRDTSTLVKTVAVGQITDADVIPTSFNEAMKERIKTDKGVFVVYGVPSVMLGSKAEVRIFSNGNHYLCAEGWNYCYRMYN